MCHSRYFARYDYVGDSTLYEFLVPKFLQGLFRLVGKRYIKNERLLIPIRSRSQF